MSNEEKISPIITRKRKSTLNSKKVDIAGTGDFGRDTASPTPISAQEDPNLNIENTLTKRPIQNKRSDARVSTSNQTLPEEIDLRKKASKTQKMSPDVILKLNTLKPYIKDLEEMGSDGNPSINDIVNMLLDNYINTKLSTRQLQGYKAVYQNLFEHL
ncbi:MULTISPECIES: hypothetical protein [Listeria]|uniref:Uncharacterized protein n=1 Tax=Listeria ivanovii subsp. londoniensis TaxID=202752 RepID=A0ABS1G7S0_LISIV|nr:MULTISPECIES: hypothetical protein [Listeria]MBC2233068.1 hypothetical protein [Listeria seeligeri]MBF2626101.1 hypothetical protein [Listeria seeligeri]MBF2673444.1 hypothetical protein [Listeria seeligeri]MBK1962918.1 hypothetical protein [Listeria ivanovii subsp. londoniensis]MBM5721720.1 hypothetical protein [Listeria ivanovii]